MATVHLYPPVRSRRFPVDVPLEVRRSEDEEWWPARTENVSATGVLFRTSKTVPPLTPVELKFQLDVGDGTVVLTCAGTVARVATEKDDSEEAYVGVSFAGFDLLHLPVDEPKQPTGTGKEMGDVFHRLNTLLFIIMGNAEIVCVPTENAALHRTAATHILDAVEEAATLVRALAARFKEQQS